MKPFCSVDWACLEHSAHRWCSARNMSQVWRTASGMPNPNFADPILAFGCLQKPCRELLKPQKVPYLCFFNKYSWDQSQLVYLPVGCWDEAANLLRGQCLPLTQLLRPMAHLRFDAMWSWQGPSESCISGRPSGASPWISATDVRSVAGHQTFSFLTVQTLMVRGINILGWSAHVTEVPLNRDSSPTLRNSLSSLGRTHLNSG